MCRGVDRPALLTYEEIFTERYGGVPIHRASQALLRSANDFLSPNAA
jgi:hypothetical protein